MSSQLNQFEKRVIKHLLEGSDPQLATLREQLAVAEVESRVSDSAGTLVDLLVPPEAARLSGFPRLVISDVMGEIEELEHGAGFALFVVDGALSLLDGYPYGEDWPMAPTLTRLFYTRRDVPGGAGVVEAQERDLDWAFGRAV